MARVMVPAQRSLAESTEECRNCQVPDKRCQLNRSLQRSLIDSSDDTFQKGPIFWAALN